jgi:hypothetical protein
LGDLKELIDSFTEGHTILYEWQNKDNHQVVINFSYDDISSKYEIDFDNGLIVKVVNSEVENISFDTTEEALDIVEKEIHSVLSISESRKGRPKSDKTTTGQKVPGKYLTKNKKLMKKEIEEFQGKDSYKKDWDADYKSGKGGKGKRWETKKSDATKSFHKKYEEFEFEVDLFIENNNSVYNSDSKSAKMIKNKSEKSGISQGILKKVYKRGRAAWNTGHRPGVSQEQWATGRVNSFITGVGGARKADADLWKMAKEQKKK